MLGIVKLVGGIVGNSFALISDAVNSIGDSLGSVIVLFALRVAQKPPDADHPYGHTRAEAVAGLSVAWLIAFSAMTVGWEAMTHMFDRHSRSGRVDALDRRGQRCHQGSALSRQQIDRRADRLAIARGQRLGPSQRRALLAGGRDRHRGGPLGRSAVHLG